jgi:hypothetical protein
LRADPKSSRPIALKDFNKVADAADRNRRGNMTAAANRPSRCDQLLRRFSWQVDEEK